MWKKIGVGVILLFLLGIAVFGLTVIRPIYQFGQQLSPATAPADYALQEDSRVSIPEPLPLEVRPFDPLKNVYWGEVHVHTKESFEKDTMGLILTHGHAARLVGGWGGGEGMEKG